MFIKREPLGKGNLTFGKRRRRFPLLLLILYFVILAGALIVFWQRDAIQPTVLAWVGPEPTATPSAGSLTDLGDAAYQAGDLVTAADYYRQAADLEPQNIQLLTDYARLLTMTEDPDNINQAIVIANRIIELAPNDARGHAAKARALDWQGNYDQAVVEGLRAVDLDPTYALGYAYLAEAYTDIGQLRDARTAAETAIQLDPFSVDARRNYAYVLEYYGDYGGAVQQYEQALQLAPNLLDLLYGLARNYRGAYKLASTAEAADQLYHQSIATYNEIILRTPDDPRAYTELGRTYFEARDDQSAQTYLQRAIDLVCGGQDICPMHTYDEIAQNNFTIPANELPPTIYLPAWRLLGNVFHTRKNYEDAIAIFDEVIAWSQANGQEPPIDAYVYTSADYYYLDNYNGYPLCNIAIPRAQTALNMYETNRMDDANILNSILSVFVLCRDYANTPPTIAFSFPSGYAEPDVQIQRGDSTATPTP